MDKDFTPRRRFLTGAASLPVVLTVQSGSALAAASSSCRIRDAEKPNPVQMQTPGEPGSPDEWMRATIQLVTLKVDGNPYTSPDGHQVFFRNTNNSFYFVYLGNDVDPIALTQPGAPLPGAANVVETPVADGTRQALVHVDETGTPTGFAWDTQTSGQKLTMSCWTSLR